MIDWAAGMERLLLRNVRPMGGPAVDLLVDGGRIAETGDGLAASQGATVADGRGQLALPGLVDAHAHLDKTLWGLPWRPHTARDGLAALIENEHRGREELAAAGMTVAERAGNLLGAFTIDLIVERTASWGWPARSPSATPSPWPRSPRPGSSSWSTAWPTSASR